jgi:Uma2 family endonuclease
MTLAEFKQVEHEGRMELLGGQLITYHVNGIQYAESSSELTLLLRLAGAKAHAHMGYLLNRTPPIWLGPSVSIPHSNQGRGLYYEGAPLIAFEVIVTNEHRIHLNSKVEAYLEHGSSEVWTLHHQDRRALVYRKDSAPRVETEAFHTDLLPGIAIPFEKFLL